mgnify:CR=1 FL=1
MGLIQCKDVCKSFGEKIALDHVSVDIPKGKIFGLLGPNGAGKTTLIRIINRITIPNKGEVLFDGRPITQDDVEKIGYLPEERGLYRKMKVGEQAMYFAQLKGMSSREAAKELNIPVFIHCGHPPYSLPWSIALLAERHPDVKVVMIHMGHGHGVYIDASLKMARRYPNLYLEMSGMPMPSKIREAYETVGADRIMFGTDSPYHPAAVEAMKVAASGLTEEQIQDVFYNNCAKLMGFEK